MRCVTRLLTAAGEASDAEAADLFLAAARLTEPDVHERFQGIPRPAQDERDMLLRIRRGAGENVDGLGVARDLLHSVSYLDAWRGEPRPGRYPHWTGITADASALHDQFEAAQRMLPRLQAARADLEA